MRAASTKSLPELVLVEVFVAIAVQNKATLLEELQSARRIAQGVVQRAEQRTFVPVAAHIKSNAVHVAREHIR